MFKTIILSMAFIAMMILFFALVNAFGVSVQKTVFNAIVNTSEVNRLAVK